MSIIGMLLVLLVIGVFLAFMPMDAKIKQIIVAIVAVLVLVWLLEMFGLIDVPTFSRVHRH